MPSLVENILSLEQRAADIVAAAHAEAKTIEQRTVEEIAVVRARIAADTTRRLSELQKNVELKQQADLQNLAAEFDAACAELAKIAKPAIRAHAARIAAQFKQG
ncbi:MAG TPA: hypothetical protein PLJ47_05315 [Candidatus Hydrogenedentes bacterium]|nr:hypothetical protein [Candidatus Hydrogenedentota bacterium]HRK33998.1 hypothetical protein [Candidatus Hydrogenedentota bacterium]